MLPLARGLKHSFGAAALMGLAAFGDGATAEPRQIAVTFVVVSDNYELADKDGRGGFARIAGAIAAERARAKNTIVVHAGDTLSPSLMSGLDRGAAVLELTNMIAPDIFVPGNHEFDFGATVFRERMAAAKFPLLAANLRAENGAPMPGFADTRIIDIEGVKIGIVGLTDEDSAVRSSPGALKFAPLVKTAEAQAKALREAGADIVALVVHAPWQTDVRLASSGNYDLVLSGHDHDLMLIYDGRTVLAESTEEGGTIVSVDLDIALETDGARKVTWHPRFRLTDTADVTPDPAVAARVAGFEAVLAKDLDVVVGTTATALDSRKSAVRSGETAIGNFIADAMREATGADIAIVNGGGIRGDRTYAAGTALTRRDIFKELPFGNKLVMLELSGADVQAALENGVWFAGKPEGRFAQVSGLLLTAKKDAVPGSRITAVEIAGAALDPAKLYKVATNDFLAAGRDGYKALANGRFLLDGNEGALLATVVMEAVKAKITIAPVVEGRIKLE